MVRCPLIVLLASGTSNCRLLLLVTIWLLFAPAAGIARAQSGPFPPQFGAYWWMGPNNGNGGGNGSTGDWNNWDGRFGFDAGNPPKKLHFPAQDGDALIIDNTFIGDNDHHVISFGGHSLPASSMRVLLNASYSGGLLEVHDLHFENSANTHGPLDPYPMDVSSTSLSAELLSVVARIDPITFSGVDVDASEMGLSGIFGLAPEGNDPPLAPPVIGFDGSQINASVLKVYGPVVANITGSTFTGLGTEIGLSGDALANAAELHLINSEAAIDQFLLVGSAGTGQLSLEESSVINAPTAYVDVGLGGEGFLHVANLSMLVSKFLSVGVTDTGNLAIDSDGKAITQTGKVGVLAGKEGTVNIEDGGIWEAKDVTIGENGTGYVYVRENAKLKLTGMGVLGKASGSRGVLHLIGADARLDLGISGSLVIGDEGDGELNLSEMATFTSQGDVKLGNTTTGSGTVTIDGASSKWTVNGALSIGENHFGRVEVRNGGTLRVEGGLLPLVIGGQSAGEGALIISGADSKVEFDEDQELVVGEFGKGRLEIRDGANTSFNKITVADNAAGDMKITSDSNKSQLVKVTGDFTIGNHNPATLAIDHDSQLETSGAVIMASTQQGSATANLTGVGARWTVTGSSAKLGSAGTATITLEDGGRFDVDGGNVIAGETSNGHGNFVLKQAGTDLTLLRVTNGTLKLGYQGSSTVDVTGGAQILTNSGTELSLGAANSGSGVVTLTGVQGRSSALNASGDLFVGRGVSSTGSIVAKQNAQLTLNGGASMDDLHGTILGYEISSTGTIDVQDTGLANPVTYLGGTVIIGRQGTGTYKIRSGNHMAANTTFALATHDLSHGTLDIAGASVTMTMHSLDMARHGTAELKLNDGASMTTDEVRLRKGSTATINAATWNVNNVFLHSGMLHIQAGGRLNMPGVDYLPGNFQALGGEAEMAVITGENAQTNVPSSLLANNIAIGDSNIGGQMTVSGGASVTANNLLSIAFFSGLQIVGHGSAPSLVTAPAMNMGADGPALLDVAGQGRLDITNSAGQGALVSAGVLTVTDAGSRATFRGRLTVGDRVRSYSGGVVAARSVLIQSSGSVDLTGGAMVIGGDLDSLPILPPNTLLVRPGGTLQGVTGLLSNPSIKGKVIIGGNLIIGQSPGLLAVDGDVQFDSTGSLQMEIGGSTPGTQFDQLFATGGVTLGGTLDLRLLDSSGGFTLPTVGQEFSLFTATGGVTGNFVNAAALRSITNDFRVDWSLVPSGVNVSVKAQRISLLADFDENGTVNAADLLKWKTGFGILADATHLQGDADGDFDVDGADLLLWQRQFGVT
ncbi:MAG: hypothetical protein JNL18_22315, partial [Planctomycetaceae bacterium]|nr:hypothetical protein [Planctomycetaceae bacterium]